MSTHRKFGGKDLYRRHRRLKARGIFTTRRSAARAIAALKEKHDRRKCQ